MSKPSWLLTCLLCLGSAAPGQEPHARKEFFNDDFAADSLANYQAAGDIRWQKGSLTFGRGVRLARAADVGAVVEATPVVGIPAGRADAGLRLTLAAQARRTT